MAATQNASDERKAAAAGQQTNTAVGQPVVQKGGMLRRLFSRAPLDPSEMPTDSRSNTSTHPEEYNAWVRRQKRRGQEVEFAAGALLQEQMQLSWLDQVQKKHPHDKLHHVFNYSQIVEGIGSHYNSIDGLSDEEIKARIQSEMEHIASSDPIYRLLMTHPEHMLPNHADFDIKKEYDRIAYMHGPDTSEAFKQQHQAWNNKLAYDAHKTLHTNPSQYKPIPKWISELGITKDVKIQEAFRRIDHEHGQGTALANQYKSELAYIYWQHIHAEPPKRVVVPKPLPMPRAPPQNTLPPRISEAEAAARFRAYANANPHSQPWHQPQPQQWQPQPQQSQWQSPQPQWESRTYPTAEQAWAAHLRGLGPVRSF